MHLIFERSKGKFKPNCNILALAWMPYYDEIKFRTALFDYHQRQLINLTSSIAANGSLQSHNGAINNRSSGPLGRSQHARALSTPREPSGTVQHDNEAPNQRVNQPLVTSSLIGGQHVNQFLNSRIAELIQRYLLLKNSQSNCLLSALKDENGIAITSELDAKYGRQTDFGWLVVGNVGKIVGVTMTSILQPVYDIQMQKLKEPMLRKSNKISVEQKEEDLMQFNESENSFENGIDATDNQKPEQSSNSHNIGMSTTNRPDVNFTRSNYNLRGHLDEVILVKWNELYQKLASIDSKGNVLIWCKINDKFTIQTPFYNRTKSVADFKWSNDGKTALICYTDSFILVGSSSGQRHWHSMLNLDDYHITCASWTPNDDQLLLGVSNGNVVVIDLPHSELTELVVNQTNIRTMCWSSCDLTLKGLSKLPTSPLPNRNFNSRSPTRNSTTIVNQRRLSRDCSVFSRYRFCSQIPSSVSNQRSASRNELDANTGCKPNSPFRSQSNWYDKKQQNILAIDFANSTIKLYDGGLDDPNPKTIVVNQESYIMNWSSDGKILAVAGFNIHTTAPSVGCLRCRYLNSIKFYNRHGELIHEHIMKYTRYPITAFTWAHEDTRLFVATGPRLHCAKVFLEIPSLSLLALSCLQRYTKIPEKGEMLKDIIQNNLKSMNVISWQSANCPVEFQSKAIDAEIKELTNLSAESCKSSASPRICNNSNIYMYRLPFKLQMKVDELFSRTIRQPYDENWSLNDIIWHVPRNEQRYYCTLVCYSSEKELSSSGHQYRTNLIANRLGENQTSDQNKIFVLYVEFLGSLIPILRARRIGFLKPEFVIFDPDSREVKSIKQRKISDSSFQTSVAPKRSNNFGLNDFEQVRQQSIPTIEPSHRSTSSYYYNEDFSDNCANLHSYPGTSNSITSSLGRMSDAENYYNYSDNGNKIKARNLVDGRSYHQEPIALPMLNNPYMMCMLSSALVGQSSSQDLTSTQALDDTMIHSIPNIPRSVARRTSSERYRLKKSSLRQSLSEVDELVRIKSNIWGTRFKLINTKNRMIKQRSVLGSLVYKASLLHLQPRQIFLNMKDMSNFCCLCSIHHHSKDYIYENPQALSESVSNSKMRKASQKSFNFQQGGVTPKFKRNEDDKVIIAVGDSIRVVPKLGFHQTYRLQEKGRLLTSNQNVNENLSSIPLEQRSYNLRKSKNKQLTLARPDSTAILKTVNSSNHAHSPQSINSIQGCSQENFQQSSNSVGLKSSSSDDELDDILTLSLGQGDQMKVEMSSIEFKQDEEDSCNLDEFLATNKTLKSIQTITKMIVDLSSKANETVIEDTKEESEFSSPSKLVKLSNDSKISPPCSSKYIAPNTPVHRPRHTFLREPKPSSSCFQTQSATTTPLKNISKYKRKAPEGQKQLDLVSLPPPPPPIPIGRRFSSSAKRFFDGSLRSLYGGYSASDVEQDDYRPLVPQKIVKTRASSSMLAQEDYKQVNHAQARDKLLKRKQLSDLSSFKANLVDVIRSSRSQSKETRKSFVEKFGKMTETKRGASLDALYSSPSASSKASASLTSSSDDEKDSLDSEYRESESETESILKEKIKRFSNSFKDLRDFNQRLGNRNSSRRRQLKRKSICRNHKCTCAKEFKLNNRPPVWNELSQVYQLDFGGRVTQESAKNLQIDFEGKLALQFGRIDRCTYTLDYKYPFNAVQAMAVALASLTQRLK